jgi:hypothetical protein
MVVVVRVEVLYLPKADFRIWELVNFSPIELPVSLMKNMCLSAGHNTQNKHSFIQQTEVLLHIHDLHESD